MKKNLCFFLALTFAVCFQQSSAQKVKIPKVFDKENSIIVPSFKLPEVKDLPEIRELPDPLLGVKKYKDWAVRRSEIAAQIQRYGIGEKPSLEKTQISSFMDGDTLVVEVSRNDKKLVLKSEIIYPKIGTPPYALMIGTSMISLPDEVFQGRPVAKMVFHEAQVNDYSQWRKDHKERGEHSFDKLFPEYKDNGAYSEWAWGFSRLVDGLFLLGEEKTKIDLKHIGVTGCSYAGKMALYCGAFDERIALVIAQEPGGGGAAAWRVSHTLDGVEDIDKTDYHWFLESQKENFSGENVYRLPYDQHELCAMVCPRALLLLGNPDFKWLADESMKVSAEAAQKVWEKFKISNRFGVSIVGNHGHCRLPEVQFPEVEKFIDNFLLEK